MIVKAKPVSSLLKPDYVRRVTDWPYANCIVMSSKAFIPWIGVVMPMRRWMVISDEQTAVVGVGGLAKRNTKARLHKGNRA
jgi:hypothetical protein